MNQPIRSIGFRELVALVAAIMSTQAFAVDGMLPALTTIGQALHIKNENHTQWIITAYILGVGTGQIFWGMLADRYGRRPILLAGLAVYALAAMLCGLATSFEMLLGWRLLHGLAAANAVVTRSVVRDLYSGRHMARVMSLTFIVFLIIPMIAPSIGQLILLLAQWRSIFMVFAGFAVAVLVWSSLRLPETLHSEYRRTLTPSHVASAARLVLTDRTSIGYSLAVAVMFGQILAYVGMVQQIFVDVFQRPSLMPRIFAICAAGIAAASYLNSRIVERFGTRRISHSALLAFLAVEAVHTAIALSGGEHLWVFVVFQATAMGCFGLAVANFGSMALQPLGAIAGIGAALQGFMTTCGGGLVGALIGRFFNGTVVPLTAGAFMCGVVGLGCVLFAERGKLFRPHEPAHAAELSASPEAVH